MQDGTSGGLFFSYCNNLLVHNATIYYEFSQYPWYQATITDISPNGQVWNITVSLFPVCFGRHQLSHAGDTAYTRSPSTAAHGDC